MLQEAAIDCPYCGEPFTSLIDMSAGEQEYIEDCQICCQPIVFNMSMDTHGELDTLTTRRDND